MAAPSTTGEFLDLLRKSGLVDDVSLRTSIEKEACIATDPRPLAEHLIHGGWLTRFQAEQLLEGKWDGFFLGRYKVLRPLASSVFLCDHSTYHRQVALKVLSPQLAVNPVALNRFFRQARAMAAVDHPNVVHAYDVDQQGGYHFLVMEYVEGQTLQEIVQKSGPMDVGRAARLMHQAAMGLEHTHARQVIHRNIEPSNILIDCTNVVRITGFGLARFYTFEPEAAHLTLDGEILGTPDYMAPEQAIDSRSVDIRADIYGLGATFYFLLAGTPPFSEGTIAQKLLWHQTRQPRPLSHWRQDVPGALAAIIEKMLAKDRTQRFQTPAALVAALAPWHGKD